MMADPKDLTDLPSMPLASGGDLLSEVLGHIRLAGEEVEALTLSRDDVLDAGKLDGACLFLVTAGELVLRIGAESYPIGAGDLVLLPEGVVDGALVAGGAATELLLARFRFDAHSLHGMVLVLPRLVHVAQTDGQPWLEGISRFLRIEAQDDQPGATLMVSRLIDLIVIRALRSWAQSGRTLGWLGGLADPRIARALAALHADPLRRWRLDELAGAAGMSRSSFSERFATLIGRPPLRYGNELRLGLARAMIGDGVRVGEAGLRIGYGSEAAFSRAYRAQFGRSPVTDRTAASR